LHGRLAERDLLLRALAALPPGQRAVLVLRYFDDLSEAETARMLGCSLGTVKSQAARALEKLRAAVGQPAGQLRRRHGRHTRQTVLAVLVILALAVPTAIGLHSGPTAARSHPSGGPAAKLPARLTGLPMPASTQFELLLSTWRGAGWYSTAT
jgi:hypothetical protein